MTNRNIGRAPVLEFVSTAFKQLCLYIQGNEKEKFKIGTTNQELFLKIKWTFLN